jgi:hypothetical protein
MSDEDVKILQALRDYRPPSKLHPIAKFAYALYEEADMDLPPEAMTGLREELKQYEDLKDLTDALCGLSAFMIYISEHLDDQKNGEKVAELIKEVGPRYSSFTDRVSVALENLGKKVKGAFDRFTARDLTEDKRAPVHDENPPEGTVPLKKMKPVAQPPPWARKK